VFDFQPALNPTMYFIGVTTEKSSIMNVFPRWARILGLGGAEIKGIDLPLHASAEEYRRVTDFLKNDPMSLGALVTTHKLDLFSACKNQFDYIDPYAQKLEEISSLSKKDGKFCAHAKDPISSGLALEHFVPQNFWKNRHGEVFLMGAGGSSLAMSLYLSGEQFGDNVPRHIRISNRSRPRLESAAKTLANLNPRVAMSYLYSPAASDNDKIIANLPPYSLIVNATGLGKDAPGSPTTEAVRYPENCLVWEINYRGDLIFMRQAQAQQKAKNLHVENGRIYFIHGWTQVIAEVFHAAIEEPVWDQLIQAAL
jgi:shikimate 5-dehydrogenase